MRAARRRSRRRRWPTMTLENCSRTAATQGTQGSGWGAEASSMKNTVPRRLGGCAREAGEVDAGLRQCVNDGTDRDDAGPDGEGEIGFVIDRRTLADFGGDFGERQREDFG